MLSRHLTCSQCCRSKWPQPLFHDPVHGREAHDRRPRLRRQRRADRVHGQPTLVGWAPPARSCFRFRIADCPSASTESACPRWSSAAKATVWSHPITSSSGASPSLTRWWSRSPKQVTWCMSSSPRLWPTQSWPSPTNQARVIEMPLHLDKRQIASVETKTGPPTSRRSARRQRPPVWRRAHGSCHWGRVRLDPPTQRAITPRALTSRALMPASSQALARQHPARRWNPLVRNLSTDRFRG